jgi:hypothetical protein
MVDDIVASRRYHRRHQDEFYELPLFVKKYDSSINNKNTFAESGLFQKYPVFE